MKFDENRLPVPVFGLDVVGESLGLLVGRVVTVTVVIVAVVVWKLMLVCIRFRE